MLSVQSRAARLFAIAVAAINIIAVVAVFAVQAKAEAPNGISTSATATASDLVRPDDMGGGSILFKSTTQGLYVPAPLLGTSVDIQVSGTIARATVTQQFQNVSDKYVEGIYVFPLPETRRWTVCGSRSATDSSRAGSRNARPPSRYTSKPRPRPKGRAGGAGAAEHVHDFRRECRPGRGRSSSRSNISRPSSNRTAATASASRWWSGRAMSRSRRSSRAATVMCRRTRYRTLTGSRRPWRTRRPKSPIPSNCRFVSMPVFRSPT